MPKIHECFNTRSQITQLAKLEGSIAYSSKLHGLKLFSHEECHILQNLRHEYLNSSTTHTTFSPDVSHVAFALNNIIYIVNLKTKKLIQTIKSIDSKITHLSFDLTSSYIIVATQKGRVLQFKYSESTLLARVFSYKYEKSRNYRGNIISSMDFYKEYIIIASYDGSIKIRNLYSKVEISSLKHSNSAITATCMVGDKTLLSGDSQGNLYKEEISNSKSIQEINTPFVSISQIISLRNPDYVLVSSSSNTIAMLNIKTGKTLHNAYLKFESDIVKMILIDEETLVVALKNNTVSKVLLPGINELKSLILHNSLDKAFMLIERNSMLCETPAYQTLQKNYRDIYLKAVDALINQNKKAALKITDSFKDLKSKKEEIKLLYAAFEIYPRFQTLFLEKNYALCYNMAAKFPALQLTNQYIKMEKVWKNVFLNAQRHILLGNKQDASALLSEYMSIVSKRPIIKLILNENKLFVEFLKATEEKNFNKVNTLAKKNSILAQLPTYKILEEGMDSNLAKIRENIKNAKLQEARVAIELIHLTPSVAEEIKALLGECKDVEKLQKAYADDNFKLCYELVDSSPHLSSTELGEMLNRHWVSLICQCEDYSLKGNIKGIKSTLAELMSIASRKEKIGDLLRVSFHIKIKQLLGAKKFKNAENIIYSYLDIFGSDNEIKYIMKQYEKFARVKLAITSDVKIARDAWMHSEIIMK